MKRDYSEATGREIDTAVREMIEEAYERAKAILTERLADLEQGAALLLEKETLLAEDFPPLLRDRGEWPLRPEGDHLPVRASDGRHEAIQGARVGS
jgi:ATP-dependent Zn protease